MKWFPTTHRFWGLVLKSLNWGTR